MYRRDATRAPRGEHYLERFFVACPLFRVSRHLRARVHVWFQRVVRTPRYGVALFIDAEFFGGWRSRTRKGERKNAQMKTAWHRRWRGLRGARKKGRTDHASQPRRSTRYMRAAVSSDTSTCASARHSSARPSWRPSRKGSVDCSREDGLVGGRVDAAERKLRVKELPLFLERERRALQHARERAAVRRGRRAVRRGRARTRSTRRRRRGARSASRPAARRAMRARASARARPLARATARTARRAYRPGTRARAARAAPRRRARSRRGRARRRCRCATPTTIATGRRTRPPSR